MWEINVVSCFGGDLHERTDIRSMNLDSKRQFVDQRFSNICRVFFQVVGKSDSPLVPKMWCLIRLFPRFYLKNIVFETKTNMQVNQFVQHFKNFFIFLVHPSLSDLPLSIFPILFIHSRVSRCKLSCFSSISDKFSLQEKRKKNKETFSSSQIEENS